MAVLGHLGLEVDPFELSLDSSFVERNPARQTAGSRRVIELHRCDSLDGRGPGRSAAPAPCVQTRAGEAVTASGSAGDSSPRTKARISAFTISGWVWQSPCGRSL